MGFYDDFIVPHCVELACGARELTPLRVQAAAGLAGRVLEIGFGSGLNLPHYPREVRELVAVDPSARARHIGRARIERAHFPVHFVGLTAERIDLDDASVDAALCTFTLCSIPDAVQALREVKRVLRPGGRLHYVEHGRAPDPGVARWQARLNPLQRWLAGGCHLDRDVPALLAAAGFAPEDASADYVPRMPRTHGYVYAGHAH